MAPVTHVDVLVVGAGPVGLVAAIALRRAGRGVVVIEQGQGPQDKACGEAIMPAGVAALATLGIDVAAHASMMLTGIRYIDGPYTARGGFIDGPGWAMRRTALSTLLRQHAADLGIRIVEHCAWHGCTQSTQHVDIDSSKGIWRAQMLIAADGLHSRVRQSLGLGQGPKAHSPQRRYGVRQHFACPPWSTDVQVYWAEGAEAYVTPVGPDAIGVAFLWGPKPARFDALLQRFPGLAARLQDLTPTSRTRGAGPLAQSVSRRVSGRVVLMGDAAGYLDALTGEGLTLGFLSALALTAIVRDARPLAAYERAYAQLSRAYYREARWLLALGARPWLRRLVMRLVACWPRLFAAFVIAHSRRRLPLPQDFFDAARDLPRAQKAPEGRPGPHLGASASPVYECTTQETL